MNEQLQSLMTRGEPLAAMQAAVCALFQRVEKALKEEVSPDLVVKYDDLMTHQEGTVSLVLSRPQRLSDFSIAADRRPAVELGRYTTSGFDGLRFRAVTIDGASKQAALAVDVAAFERSLMDAMSQAHVAAWLVRVKQAVSETAPEVAPVKSVEVAPATVAAAVTPEVDDE